LGEYRGKIVLGSPSGAYVLDSGHGFAWDASDTSLSAWPRFINSSQWQGTQLAEPNVQFVKGINENEEFTVFIRALREIKQGEELFIDYGPYYS
jgi:hypothetical protein